MDLYVPTEADALAAALAAAGPAAQAARAAIAAAMEGGDWGAALLALDALAAELALALEGPLLAAALLGMARVGDRLPASSAPQSPAPPASSLTPEVLRLALASVPAESRQEYLAALSPAQQAAIGQAASPPPEVIDGTEELPLAEAAARRLLSRRLVPYARLKTMSQEARERSWAVAGLVRESAAQEVRQALAEEVAAGPSLAGFRQRVDESAFVSPAALETAFRDAVQTAHADGMGELLSNPVVGDAFPFVERLPIRDSRLSEVCALASRSGIGGTGIYRRDDPAWRRVRPPTHHNCRCGISPLTAEMARAKGIAPPAGHVTLPARLVALLGR